jgi:hypothetical protein
MTMDWALAIDASFHLSTTMSLTMLAQKLTIPAGLGVRPLLTASGAIAKIALLARAARPMSAISDLHDGDHITSRHAQQAGTPIAVGVGTIRITPTSA